MKKELKNSFCDKGWIYLIREGNSKYYKIGQTNSNPDIRLAALQVGNHRPLKYIFKRYIYSVLFYERKLHEMFRKQRIRKEWFYLNKENVSLFFKSCKEFKKHNLGKNEKEEADILNNQDIEDLLNAPDRTKFNNFIKCRDRAILGMLIYTGLTVSELTSLTRKQVELGQVSIIIKKGERQLLLTREVYLTDNIISAIREWLEERTDNSKYLFVRYNKKKDGNFESLTNRSIQRSIEYYSKIIGINKKVTPRSLRSNFATRLYQMDVDIPSIQKMMGHSNCSTTQSSIIGFEQDIIFNSRWGLEKLTGNKA